MNHPTLVAPRRILMTTDPIGGVWTYTMELCEVLAEHEVHVLLASMGETPRPDQRAQVQRLPNVEFAESEFRLEWMDSPWKDVDDAGEWLLELERGFNPDVVHLNGYAHGALHFRSPKLIVAHSCVLSWWRAVKSSPIPHRCREYTRRVRAGLLGASMLVAPTRAMLIGLEAQYAPFLSGEVIYNGRNPEKFKVRTKEERILGVGRLWDEAKNISMLAEIAPQLPWPVFVAGECNGPDGQRLNSRNLQVVGRLTESGLIDEYERSAIFAAPARYEPFGLSVLEAALAGCALVLGDIPSLRELWSGAAEFVNPSDRTALRDRIRHLIKRPLRRQALADKARGRALQMNSQKMGEAYWSAYADVMMTRVPAAQETGSPLLNDPAVFVPLTGRPALRRHSH
ncbi:MAG TPA: glycosyltransferase family 4 protein [Verrucomicrobiae bacterium]|nr:glycosyltransferase family 4 protein [Verrucomicrobiae bacterium]